MANWEQIRIKTIDDERGSLSILESDANFSLKRAYYLYGSDEKSVRGAHAHKALNQIIVAVAGSCRLKLNDGKNEEDFEMNDPSQAIRVYPLVWRDIYDFSEDCVLMVFADQNYDEADYIREYEEFERIVKGKS